jgi:hypothetical protein
VEQNLNSLANLAEILGAVFLIGGVVFAVIQIRQFRRQRLEVAAIELVRSFQSPEFTRAFTLLLGLPNGLSAAELRQRDPEAEVHVMLMSITMESIGIMVYRRILPLAMVEELMGGVVEILWTKLENWVKELREEQDQPELHEWFQWLAERLKHRTVTDQNIPAHLKHRHWKA